MAEFAVLQDVLRKQDYYKSSDKSYSGTLSLRSRFLDEQHNSNRTGLVSEWTQTTAGGISEMSHLEIFFREYDPMRIFSGLQRVAGTKMDGLAIWTTPEVIAKFKDEVELASVEQRLRELKKELSRMDKLKAEVTSLNEQANMLRINGEAGYNTHGSSTTTMSSSSGRWRINKSSSSTRRKKHERRKGTKNTKANLRIRPFFGTCPASK